jgi:hypothetical protein
MQNVKFVKKKYRIGSVRFVRFGSGNATSPSIQLGSVVVVVVVASFSKGKKIQPGISLMSLNKYAASKHETCSVSSSK